MKKIFLSMVFLLVVVVVAVGVRWGVERFAAPEVVIAPLPSSIPFLLPKDIDPETANEVLRAAEVVQDSTEAFFSQVRADVPTVLLQSIAEKRKTEMQFLIREAPGVFLQLVISDEERGYVPDALTAYFEEPVRIAEGVMEVFHIDDFDDNISREDYYVRDGGERLNFYPVGEIPSFLSGTTVNINGYRLDDDVVVDVNKRSGERNSEDTEALIHTRIEGRSDDVYSASLVEVARAGEHGGDFDVIDFAEPEALGAQRTLVILVKNDVILKNQGLTIDDLPTTEEMHEFVFGGRIQEFFKEVSFDKMSLEGDVIGWYDSSSLDFSLSGFLDSVDNDVVFVDPHTREQIYDRIMFGVGDSLSGGDGTVGTLELSTDDGDIIVSLSRFPVPGREDFFRGDRDNFLYAHTGGQTFAHEFGHGLGVYHANGWFCGDEILMGECENAEYANSFDIMGNRSAGFHFNAFFKHIFEWLTEEEDKNGGRVLIIDEPGEYLLMPLEESGAIVARIQSPLFPRAPIYYLEHRRPVGFDVWMDSNFVFVSDGDNLDDIAFLNWAYRDGGARILDMFPGEDPSWNFKHVALLSNLSFSDGVVSITNLGADDASGGLRVSVDFSSDFPDCSVLFPRVDVEKYYTTEPSRGFVRLLDNTVELNAGERLRTLPFNFDASGNPYCTTSLPLMVERVVPKGWDVELSEEPFELVPDFGMHLDIPFSVFVPRDVEKGEYDVAVRVHYPEGVVEKSVTVRVSEAVELECERVAPRITSSFVEVLNDAFEVVDDFDLFRVSPPLVNVDAEHNLRIYFSIVNRDSVICPSSLIQYDVDAPADWGRDDAYHYAGETPAFHPLSSLSRKSFFDFPADIDSGEYSVVFRAANIDSGLSSEMELIVVVSGRDVSASPDVNGDGVVNIFDLVLVSQDFGKEGIDLLTDTNRDGVVNIFDLVIVSGSWGRGR